ncbi:MAG: EAL domain-containing protein, partial [Eggerthella sp.]|nr:EAL domain-containing protein [Eggerthella sp.]
MKVQDMAQNLYSDTRGQSERPVTFTEAVIDGLAAGGGLYVPERIPELSLDEIGALAELPYAQRAVRIYRAFDVDLPAETVEALMAQAYGDNFDDERICPITSLSADTHVLELWHGPTSAFKDMALQCLPRFFSASAAQLREQGIQISIDDFGTGYSSLSRLSYFPFDKIKIDRSFVINIPEQKDDLDIVRLIISMGKSLHMRIVAEGV